MNQPTPTGSGRLSSLGPALQAIPLRTKQGRALRQAFTNPLVGLPIGYAQAELALLGAGAASWGLERPVGGLMIDPWSVLNGVMWQGDPDAISLEARTSHSISLGTRTFNRVPCPLDVWSSADPLGTWVLVYEASWWHAVLKGQDGVDYTSELYDIPESAYRCLLVLLTIEWGVQDQTSGQGRFQDKIQALQEEIRAL